VLAPVVPVAVAPAAVVPAAAVVPVAVAAVAVAAAAAVVVEAPGNSPPSFAGRGFDYEVEVAELRRFRPFVTRLPI